MKPQRVASWLIFAIGLGLGLAGLVATAPARVVDIGRRGQLESGCRFESDAAIEVGARALVRGMLAVARDETIPPEAATCAEARIGESWNALPALRA